MIKIQYDGKSKFIQWLCETVNNKAELGETEISAYRGDRGKIAYEHSQSDHALIDAQVNVIEIVKVNGVALTPDGSKTVNVDLPTVNDGTVTIKQNGVAKGTFTMNQSGDVSIELD